MGKDKLKLFTNADALGPLYWAAFNDFRSENNLQPQFDASGARFLRHRLTKQGRNPDIHYEARIRINNPAPQVSARVIFKAANNIKSLFDLVAQEKTEIEEEIGFPLEWNRDAGNDECQILVKRDDMDPRDDSDWRRQHTWLSEVVEGFEALIRPRIAKLPLDDDILAGSLLQFRRYKLHRRIERDHRAAKLVKQHHGTRCQACDLLFEERYGELGRGFIEAHHLRPLSSLEEGAPVAYDVAGDFAVLCSNCHRMIHKTADVSDLEGFRRLVRRECNADARQFGVATLASDGVT
jgi:hypothetical protein